MKTGKIIIAGVMTIVLLLMARRLSTRHPEDLISEANNVRLTHRSITEQVAGNDVQVQAKLQAEAEVEALLHYRAANDSSYHALKMARLGEEISAFIPGGRRGDRLHYFLSAVDSTGKTIAQLPANSNLPLLIKIKGTVSTWLLIAHIFCMFGSFFFMLLASVGAVEVLRGAGNVAVLLRNSLTALNLVFIGGFPLGIAVAYQAFGVGWGGVPYGWDITDNKTLIIFLVWLATVFIGFKQLRREAGHSSLSRVSHRGIALMVICSVMITLAVYLVPHSI